MAQHSSGTSKRHSSWYANSLNDLIRFAGFVLLIVIAVFVYRYLFSDIISGRSHFIAYVLLWLFTAYFVLPRLYRMFSKLYLPNYFFGRTQTGDGLLSDPINLAFNGRENDLIAAMQAAGWTQADHMNLGTGLKLIYAAIRGVRYRSAPVSSAYLFSRKQDFAFEKIVGGNPRRRHHVRFWRTPEKWWLPGGYKADWLAAATFDSNLGLSLFTGQVTHKIDANVDKERDFIIDTLRHAKVLDRLTIVKHFTSSYHTRNGGGDVIHTDGKLPFITVSRPTKHA